MVDSLDQNLVSGAVAYAPFMIEVVCGPASVTITPSSFSITQSVDVVDVGNTPGTESFEFTAFSSSLPSACDVETYNLLSVVDSTSYPPGIEAGFNPKTHSSGATY